MYAFIPSNAPVDVARIEEEARVLRSATIAGFGAACGRGIRNAFRGLVGAYRDARRMQETYRELSALSDRELRDMGISRSDIPAIVAGTFTREPVVETPAAAPEAIERPANDDELRIAA